MFFKEYMTYKYGIKAWPAVLLLIVILLQGCGITRVSHKKGQLVGEGIASWYGPNFHGQQTANGETYDMDKLTAAHRTLPFNTRVRVVNQDNNQSVVVRINDRGPYAKGRIIDLSRKAAHKIDMISTGTAPVRLYVVGEGDSPVQSGSAAYSGGGKFTLQVGSFKEKGSADAVAKELDDAYVRKTQSNGRTVYRVYYGKFSDSDEASSAKRKLRRKGYQCFVKQL